VARRSARVVAIVVLVADVVDAMPCMPWSMVNNWVWSFTWHQLCGTDGRRTESAPVEGQNDLEVRSLSDIFGHEPHHESTT